MVHIRPSNATTSQGNLARGWASCDGAAGKRGSQRAQRPLRARGVLPEAATVRAERVEAALSGDEINGKGNGGVEGAKRGGGERGLGQTGIWVCSRGFVIPPRLRSLRARPKQGKKKKRKGKKGHSAKNQDHLIKTRQTHFIRLLASSTVRRDWVGLGWVGWSILSLQLPKLSFSLGKKKKTTNPSFLH